MAVEGEGSAIPSEAVIESNALFNAQPVADCNKFGAAAKIPVSGHQIVAGKSGHLAYSPDGYYVYAATCYIAEKLKASKA
jgi:hypothetical protein